MMRYLFSIGLMVLPLLLAAQNVVIPFERTEGTRTPPYQLVRDVYNRISVQSSRIKIEEAGPTDVAYPLRVVYYSGDGSFDVEKWKQAGKVIILINNGIHPGEPDGIDATMVLLNDIVKGKVKVPDNVVLAIIPVFNIGGHLEMRPHTRANQNGPPISGFRGNAQNLDLNRDFIKMDARETQTLVKLFHKLDPDILLDNHVSNGADYQHIMTLLSTQHNKLGGPMGTYLNEKLEPRIYEEMKKSDYDLVPYVNVWGTTPDKGWTQFQETPRFLSGFAAMFHTYAFVAETHMLKPYPDRVKATYQLMVDLIKIAGEKSNDIKATRRQQKDWVAHQTDIAISWEVDTTKSIMIDFKGYEGLHKTSEISGLPRLYYDRNKPYRKKVPFHDTYKPEQIKTVPEAYIVKQGWHDVIDKLKMNGVEMRQMEFDSTTELTVYYIADYKTTEAPYEGHYLHSNIKVRPEKHSIVIRKGDYYIPAQQKAKRYIIETLEPTAPDGFFAWGFFDAILQQKEYFSAYVFEDLAVDILNNDPALKKEFEYRKSKDAAFAKDARAQLHFIYTHSDYYEPEHMRYPVFRLE